ncbi:PIG-L deacetylase family protein [Mycolicibacterium tusciae]|uniref:PIG-L deacetylase family protein n=1 Tax=Mycolicibacterium tusciae TaxID=75922 RepID=UPI001EF834FE|nr:PIG-L deacetylase family protein [Mycolicibacterium tusciae]
MSSTAGAPVLGDVAHRGAVLAVLAHPDDESFGVGAVLAALAAAGAEVRVLCLTYGEASTLGASVDLATVRRHELTAAAERLGVTNVVLHDFPDGHLGEITPATLDKVVQDSLGDVATLVVFEPGGVTGHPDHQAATAAALRVADRNKLAVLEWGVASTVADSLNAEFATTFVALDGDGTVDIAVDRAVQLAAIACHESQARDNPVLTRRLQLQGPVERIRAHPPARSADTIS